MSSVVSIVIQGLALPGQMEQYYVRFYSGLKARAGASQQEGEVGKKAVVAEPPKPSSVSETHMVEREPTPVNCTHIHTH